MTAAEAREKSLSFAHYADRTTGGGNPRAGTTYATLALFWQHEADRLEKLEEEKEVESIFASLHT